MTCTNHVRHVTRYVALYSFEAKCLAAIIRAPSFIFSHLLLQFLYYLLTSQECSSIIFIQSAAS